MARFKPKGSWTLESIKRQIQTKIRGYDTRSLLLYGEENCCAIGAFIPPKLEGEVKAKGASSFGYDGLVSHVPACAQFMPLDRQAMNELQQLHDRHSHSGPGNDPRPALLAWVDANVEESALV